MINLDPIATFLGGGWSKVIDYVYILLISLTQSGLLR